MPFVSVLLSVVGIVESDLVDGGGVGLRSGLLVVGGGRRLRLRLSALGEGDAHLGLLGLRAREQVVFGYRVLKHTRSVSRVAVKRGNDYGMEGDVSVSDGDGDGGDGNGARSARARTAVPGQAE